LPNDANPAGKQDGSFHEIIVADLVYFKKQMVLNVG